jgi:hypothetical protein
MAAEVQAVAVAPPPTDSLSVPTAVVPASANERMRIAHTDGLGVALRNAARLDTREPRGLLEEFLLPAPLFALRLGIRISHEMTLVHDVVVPLCPN